MASVANGVTTADTGNTPNASGSFTPAVNELLAVAVVCSESVSDADDVPTASANGLTFVRATHGLFRTSLDSIDLYVANQLVPSNPVAMTVSWAPSDAGTGTVINAQRVSSMLRSGTDAILQTAKADNQAAAGTPAVTFGAALTTTNASIVAVGNSTNAAGVTEPSGWTERADTGYATPTTGLEVASRDSGSTLTTVTWGGTSASAFGAVGVELDASVPDGPTVAITKTATLTSTAATLDIVITGCVIGQRLVAVFGGDNGTGSGNVSAASAATQAGPGTTGAWTEPAENLGTTNESWACTSSTTVTGNGDITVRLARTQSTGQPWAGFIALCGNAGAIGNASISTQSATETASLTTSANSAVLGMVIDWDNLAEGNTIFTPNDAIYIERNNATGVAWYQGYWLDQAAGTRSYGLNGTSSSTALRVILVEVLVAAGGDATATPDVLARSIAMPASTPSAGVVKEPAVVAAVGTLPQSTPAVSDAGAPDVLAATGSLPQATPSAGATLTPAPVAAVLTAPQATPVTDTAATATPDAIAAVGTIPQATPQIGITVTPSATAATAAFPAATPHGDAGTSPAVVAATVALPRPGVLVGAGPAVVAAVAAFPQATPQVGGSATAQPEVLAAAVGIAQAGATITAGPAMVAFVVGVPQATGSIGKTVEPAVFAATAAFPQASPLTAGNATATPAPVALIVSFYTPSAGNLTIVVGNLAGPNPDQPGGILSPSVLILGGVSGSAADQRGGIVDSDDDIPGTIG